MEKLLLASPDILCKRIRSAFLGAKLEIMVLKYFLSQGIFSRLPNSIGLIDGLLPYWRRPYCPKLPTSYIFCCS